MGVSNNEDTQRILHSRRVYLHLLVVTHHRHFVPATTRLNFRYWVEGTHRLCTDHEGLFWIYSRLADGVTYEQAEAAIRNELEQLQQKEVSRAELEKVRNRFESEQIFSNLSGVNFAEKLALAEWYGDVTRAWREIDMYRAVTPTDIKRVAKELFRQGNSSVLLYKKAKK